ncbi:hypothetical protein [Rhodococcus sp. NPDC127528]|uniref:hypothetical protein n=1 Tax=unclassified Rhodococcus (in: high G+C Gram-positive bacteria) TaxID=192944 RepID=UPI0036331E76
MKSCTGAQDWRGGVRSYAYARATPRAHALLHGRRADRPAPGPRPQAPRDANPRAACDGPEDD